VQPGFGNDSWDNPTAVHVQTFASLTEKQQMFRK
jgi:hypothetical protein